MEFLPKEKIVSPESLDDGILTEPETIKFINSRNINPDSLPLIKELSYIHKDTIINCMHNFFAFYQGEKAITALIRSAEQATSDESKRTYELFLSFTEQNDWYAARHLVGLLEERSQG